MGDRCFRTIEGCDATLASLAGATYSTLIRRKMDGRLEGQGKENIEREFKAIGEDAAED